MDRNQDLKETHCRTENCVYFRLRFKILWKFAVNFIGNCFYAYCIKVFRTTLDKYQKKRRKYVLLCFCAFRILLFLKFKPFYNISTGVLNFFDKTLQRSWKPLKFTSPGTWNQNTADKNLINSWIDPFRMESNKMSAMMNLRVQRSRWGKEGES